MDDIIVLQSFTQSVPFTTQPTKKQSETSAVEVDEGFIGSEECADMTVTSLDTQQRPAASQSSTAAVIPPAPPTPATSSPLPLSVVHPSAPAAPVHMPPTWNQQVVLHWALFFSPFTSLPHIKMLAGLTVQKDTIPLSVICLFLTYPLDFSNILTFQCAF